MKKRYEGGGEVDALEAMNYSDEARDIAESVGTGARNMDTPKAKPKAKPKSTPKSESKPAPKAASDDVTKMSVAERAKASREKARAGSGATDTRSVNERLRSVFGMKSGGSVGSASKRADGIASKGKTRGRFI